MSTIAEIRRQNLDALARELGTLDAVASAAGTSPVYLSQLRNAAADSKTSRPRSMGSTLARRIEAAVGKPEGWMDRQHLFAGEPAAPYAQAQQLSLSPHDAPPTIAWEAIVPSSLPVQFQVAAPDDALAPRLRMGQLVLLDRSLTARPGDGVLTADGTGTLFLRVYRERRPGAWEAHALNDAFQPLDSIRDQLTVIAVIVAVHARWS